MTSSEEINRIKLKLEEINDILQNQSKRIAQIDDILKGHWQERVKSSTTVEDTKGT